jgi:hypothetical protein
MVFLINQQHFIRIKAREFFGTGVDNSKSVPKIC